MTRILPSRDALVAMAKRNAALAPLKDRTIVDGRALRAIALARTAAVTELRTPAALVSSAIGVARARSGRAFEDELEHAHHLYERQRRGTFGRGNPPVSGIPGSLRYTGPGTVDYHGTLPGGRSIVFDAKVYSGKQSYRHNPEAHHQLRFLEGSRALGAVAFILVYDRELAVCYVLTDFRPLLAGLKVELRSRIDRVSKNWTPRHPMLACTPLAELGVRPMWDYLPVAIAACETSTPLAA